VARNIQGAVRIDEPSFQADVRCQLELRNCAKKVLGVGDDASADDIKLAWGKACLEMLPDRNPGDPDAHKKFCLVHCACHCLTDGRLCKELLGETKASADLSPNGKYNLANPWGLYALAAREILRVIGSL